ncbi:MAG: ribonuclease P protein component [Treponema sp.]|nr:ribonuclease P protein component [Treponema sp.]
MRDVFRHGRRFGCRGAKLFVKDNDLSYSRICFTFSHGFGNAVRRNRAKRLSREAYRLLQPGFSGGYDLILQIFPETKAVLSDRTEQLRFLFKKAGLLK